MDLKYQSHQGTDILLDNQRQIHLKYKAFYPGTFLNDEVKHQNHLEVRVNGYIKVIESES